VFGEMALVDRTPRLASAVAESDCELLAIRPWELPAFSELRRKK